jgi:hypothetical protein
MKNFMHFLEAQQPTKKANNLKSIGFAVYQEIINQKTTLLTSRLALGMYLIKIGNGTNYEFKK